MQAASAGVNRRKAADNINEENYAMFKRLQVGMCCDVRLLYFATSLTTHPLLSCFCVIILCFTIEELCTAARVNHVTRISLYLFNTSAAIRHWTALCTA